MAFIEIDGIAARYVLQGQAGPLLVLIHEMGGSLDSWDDVAERLQENWPVFWRTRHHKIAAPIPQPLYHM